MSDNTQINLLNFFHYGNNPLKYTDPSGYKAAPLEPDPNDPSRRTGGGPGGYYMGDNLNANYGSRGSYRYNFSAANARADGYFGIVRDDNGNYLYNEKEDIKTYRVEFNWGGSWKPFENGFTYVYDNDLTLHLTQVTVDEDPAANGGGRDYITDYPTYLTLVKNFKEFNREEYIKNFQ